MKRMDATGPGPGPLLADCGWLADRAVQIRQLRQSSRTARGHARDGGCSLVL